MDRITLKSLNHFIYQSSPIWKAGLSAGIAWELAQWTHTTRPYFAPLAAILCTQATVIDSLTRGYQRVLGIVGGIVVAELSAHYLGVNAWSVTLIVLIGTGLASVLRLGQQATPQVGVSAMMVLTLGIGLHHYAVDRIIETAIGAFVAVVVNMFILPPDLTETAERALLNAADHLAARFDAVAKWLEAGAPEDEGNQLREPTRDFVVELHGAYRHVDLALSSLRFSPLVHRRRLSLLHLQSQLLHLRQGYAHATGMVRTLVEWKQSGTLSDAERVSWAQRFMTLRTIIINWKTTSLYTADKRVEESDKLLATLGEIHQNYAAALLNDARQMEKDFTGNE